MILISERNNSYFFSHRIPQILYVHPILNHLISLHQKGIDVKKWVDDFNDTSIFIRGQNINTNKKDVKYYYDYFQFLMENKYFHTFKKVKLEESRKYTPEDVEFRAANNEQIVLEVTDGCNLNCRYCGYGEFYSGYDPRRGRKMNVDTARKIIDYIISLKRKYFSYIKTHRKIAISFYGGEPLLNFPLIRKVVSYIKIIDLPNIEFFFSLTTNGILIDKYVDFFIENSFILFISLDGDKQNNGHRVFRDGRQSFDVVYKNILELKKKNPEYFEKLVYFNCVMHNKNSPVQVTKFFKEKFNKKPRLIGLAKVGLKPEKKDEFEKMLKSIKSEVEQKVSEFYIKDLKKTDSYRLKDLDDFSTYYSGYVHNRIASLLQPPVESVEYVSTGTCHPFERKMFVTVNGKLIPCERIMQNFYMGTIINGHIHLDYQQIADKYNGYYKKLSKLCNNCYNNRLCPKCIFNLNIEDENIRCDSFLNSNDFSKKVSHAISLLERAPLFYEKIMKSNKNEGDV
jgi:uncharacterized protein